MASSLVGLNPLRGHHSSPFSLELKGKQKWEICFCSHNTQTSPLLNQFWYHNNGWYFAWSANWTSVSTRGRVRIERRTFKPKLIDLEINSFPSPSHLRVDRITKKSKSVLMEHYIQGDTKQEMMTSLIPNSYSESIYDLIQTGSWLDL